MGRNAARRVLAIGLDAAEPSLVQQMITEGELPVLGRLAASGTWSNVSSQAGFGSGTVWPTFFTGTDATEHGFYTHWSWRPESMELQYYDERRYTPFWKRLEEDGVTVGVLDVPFAPFVGLSEGFELHEWGAHALVEGRMRVSPPVLDGAVVQGFGRHPHAYDSLKPIPRGHEGLSEFGSETADGIRLRGELARRLLAETDPRLAIVVFPEVHHAGHYLWHTVEPENPIYADLRGQPVPRTSLPELYRLLDDEVGRLVAAAEPDTAVFVFALHGMQAARGVPGVLDPLLADLGMVRTRVGAERRRAVVAAAKRNAPALLRNAYRSRVPLAVRGQLGRSSILPMYDWSRTRAFSLPTDQHGWIRINLRGREAHGIVAPFEYGPTCDLIEERLRALTAADGRPLVKEVLRPDGGPLGAPAELPDLVVHWADAGYQPPVRVNDHDADPIRMEETGQHGSEGFLIGPNAAGGVVDDAITVKDIHRTLVAALGR